jgi:hypothetical protein
MLQPGDEGQHPPGDHPRWQENYILLGWDEERSAAVYLHLGRIPAAGRVEVKMAAALGGRRASATVHHAGDSCFDLPGVKIDVVEPFRHWHVAVDARGAVDEFGGWVAEQPTGDVRFGFDLDVTSELGPADWTAATTALGLPDVILDHYEVACRFSGSLWCGDHRADVSGLLIRDHSWGPRDLARFDLAWWTPAVFDDATAFVSGVTILAGGRYRGFTLIDTGDGPQLGPEPWVRIAGFPEPYRFSAAAVLIPGAGGGDRIDFECRMPFPVRYPEMGEGSYICDVFSVATWGDRRGFGTVELNRSETPRRDATPG